MIADVELLSASSDENCQVLMNLHLWKEVINDKLFRELVGNETRITEGLNCAEFPKSKRNIQAVKFQGFRELVSTQNWYQLSSKAEEFIKYQIRIASLHSEF